MVMKVYSPEFKADAVGLYLSDPSHTFRRPLFDSVGLSRASVLGRVGVRALAIPEQDLLERLLPVRRLRAVKRKMSNYHLKRTEHRLWPQPTGTGTQAVLITRPQPTSP